MPIRRLVKTGKDTIANIQLLLGPQWVQNSSFWEDARIDIFLNPPRGSPSFAVHHTERATETGITFAPRPASAEETAKIRSVREMQHKIRAHLGSRKEPTTQDMQTVLNSYGADWSALLQIYTLAVNTMDQGVEAV